MYLLERQTPISARPAGFVAVVRGVAGFVPSSRLHVDLTGNALSTEVIPLGPSGSSATRTVLATNGVRINFLESDFLGGSVCEWIVPKVLPYRRGVAFMLG
jgi:hypothetical protein